MPRRSSKNPRTTGSRYNARINRTPRTNPSQTRTAEFNAIKVPVKQLLAAIDWLTNQRGAEVSLHIELYNGVYMHELVEHTFGTAHTIGATFAKKLSYISAFKTGNQPTVDVALTIVTELYENRAQ